MFSQGARYTYDYLTIFFSRRCTAKQCGHRTRRKGKISAFGSSNIIEIPTEDHGSIDWCLRCIEKMAIPCAWCGEGVFIGDPVTRHHRNKNTLPCAISCDEDHNIVIGCLRWECSDIFDRAGFWMPGEDGKGYIERTPSPLELVAQTGKGIIVSDAGDYHEAHDPPLSEV